jgi:hypothetical protein
MSVTNIKTVNFGKSKTGLTGDVGYSIYKADGTISQPRTSVGIYELGASGIYASEITFEAGFHGTILWDVTDSGNTVYASEEYNASSSSTLAISSITNDVEFIRQMEAGQWKIDAAQKHMVFYKNDNETEIARFALYDRKGNPSIGSVFTRKRIPTQG